MSQPLFVGQLLLDRKAVHALRLTDAYSLHRVVYSLFSDNRNAQQKQGSTASGIAYVDKGGDLHHRKILLLSDRPPATTTPEGYGEVIYRALPEDFLTYSVYRFQTVVNPTRRDSASRRLMAVRGREEVAQWFCERAVASWGFDVSPHLEVREINVQRFRDKNQNQVTVGQAHIQGILTVRDRATFEHSFSHGIGRARTFGCGLLQLSPIN